MMLQRTRSRKPRSSLIAIILVIFLCGCVGGDKESREDEVSWLLPDISGFNLPNFSRETATPPAPVTVDLANKLDSEGYLLEDFLVSSADGEARIFFPQGTQILDSNGEPLDSIIVSAGYVSTLLEENRLIWGLVYDFSPTDVKIQPQILITICYDPPFLESDKDENDPLLGVLDRQSGTWEWLDGEIDLNKFCVTVETNTLGCYGLSLGIIYDPPAS